MLPTAIGLPSNRRSLLVYAQCQDWMQSHGLSPYMPQLRYSASYNLGMAYNPVTKGLDNYGGYGWTRQMIDEVVRFSSRMVFHYGGHYYLSRPDTLRWRGADGVERTVDGCSVQQLTDYLSDSLRWLRARGVSNPDPYIMVDEPPHRADDGMGGGKYGWSIPVETRIVKFVRCAQAGGWHVHVAVPNYQSLAFWRGKGQYPTADGSPRLKPDVWVLRDKDIDNYPGDLIASARSGAVGIWLYNSTTINGLADRMQRMATSGWLTWSGDTSTKKVPTATLFSTVGGVFAPRQEAWDLLAQLKLLDTPAPMTIEQILADHERRLLALEELEARR